MVIVILGVVVWMICKCRASKEKGEITPIGPTTETLAAFDNESKNRKLKTMLSEEETKPPTSGDEKYRKGVNQSRNNRVQPIISSDSKLNDLQTPAKLL